MSCNRSHGYCDSVGIVEVLHRLCTPDFKWQGSSNGGKNQNQKHSLGLQKKKTQKILQTPKNRPNFLVIKIYSWNYATETCYSSNFHESFRLLWIPKKSLLKSSYPKRYCRRFSTQKYPENWKFQTHKNPLIIPVTWNSEAGWHDQSEALPRCG